MEAKVHINGNCDGIMNDIIPIITSKLGYLPNKHTSNVRNWIFRLIDHQNSLSFYLSFF